MFKILVVLWFIRFFINLFTNNIVYRECNESLLKSLKKYNVNNTDDINNLSTEGKTDVYMKMIFIFIIMIYKLALLVVDFIIMLNMLKYDPYLITKIFIAWTCIDVFVSSVKSKFSKKLTLIESAIEIDNKFKKFRIYEFIFRLANVLYWGYAIYLLYFN